MLHLKPQSQEHAIILTCDSETLDKCGGSSIKPIKPNPSWFVWYEQTPNSSSSLPLSPSLALVSSKACCTCCGWVMSTWRRVRRCEQVLCSSLAPSPFRSNTVANTSKPRESRCLAVAFPKPESQPAGTKRAFFSSSCLFTVNIKENEMHLSLPLKKKKSKHWFWFMWFWLLKVALYKSYIPML